MLLVCCFRKKKRPTKDFASLALLVVVFWSPFSISLLVVADFTHDPPDETLAVLETPGVDDDFSRAKKKPTCLDDRDTNPKPLSIKIETQCRVLKSNPQGPPNSRRTTKLVLVF